MLSTSKFLLFLAIIGACVVFAAPTGSDLISSSLRDALEPLQACITHEVDKQIVDACGKLERNASCEEFGKNTRCIINHLETLCHMENAGEVLLGFYKVLEQDVHVDPERKKCREDFRE